MQIGMEWSGSMETRMIKEVIPVTGMTSTSCGNRIESALGIIQGVKEVTASLDTSKIYVAFDVNRISLEELKQIIRFKGFTPLTMEEFNHLHDSKMPKGRHRTKKALKWALCIGLAGTVLLLLANGVARF